MKRITQLLAILFALTLGIAAQDTQPPTVAITSPANYGTVTASSTVTITAIASDNVEVKLVHFYVDGAFMCIDLTAPYECLWKVPKGKKNYSLFARAIDTAGNMTTSQAVVVVGK